MNRKLMVLLVALMMALVGSTASASSTTEVVTPADVTLQAENTPPTDEWVAYFRNAGSHMFVLGPATPPPATPTCNGLPATVYVQGGVIAGGPDDGEPYDGKLIGTGGGDVMVGTEGRDAINGRAGNDTICALGGDDRIEGAAGNDTMYGGPGSDRFKGGAGTDTAPDFNLAEGDSQEKVEQLP
jgi:hypothetical protein